MKQNLPTLCQFISGKIKERLKMSRNNEQSDRALCQQAYNKNQPTDCHVVAIQLRLCHITVIM